MSNKIILPPAGKRTKTITIQGFFQEETTDEINKRNEILAKIFLSLGVMNTKTKLN